jgi:PAS domain S-box-containing protein
MLDPDGIVTSWNPGARRFKGYEASEIIGQHFSRFYPEEDRTAGLPARVLEISKRTSKFEGEGWRVRKDGSQFWAFRLHTSEPRREPADARYHAALKARTGSPPAMNSCHLPLELNAVGTLSGHGFHPLKAQLTLSNH